MRSIIIRIALAGMAGFLASSLAQAECTEDARRITLDKENVIRVKSYACRVGEGSNAPQIKVELHRFSDIAASLIVANRSSSLLTKTIGKPKVVENDVFKSYAELLQKFGSTIELPKGQGEIYTGLSITSPSGERVEGAADVIAGERMKTVHSYLVGGDYPATDEIVTLRKKTIPVGLKFFYSIECLDEDADKLPAGTSCKKYDKTAVAMKFWRTMRSEDLANYSQNVKSYNRLLAGFKADLRASGKRSDVAEDPMPDRGLPRELRLYQFLAGSSWPEDFSHVIGGPAVACGIGAVAGIDGWKFEYTGRDVFLEAVLIENASKQPISIGGLFGSRAAEPRLRVARVSNSRETGTTSLGEMSETLAAGQRLLVPTKIILAPDQVVKDYFRYTQTAREILGRLGTNKFNGNTSSHEAPRFRDYAYGPELAVGGILVDGARVNLTQQSANFTVLAVSSQIGSCPYLLSWDANDREWIEHGKVLHRAQGQQQEYTETIVYPGFRPRFRLEEREAEVAFIDHAELTVVLIGGKTLTLQPKNTRLAARDASYLRLLWEEYVEFAFELPHGVAAADVTESRLVLTGFYERYSNLPASAETGIEPGPNGLREAGLLRVVR